MIAYIDASVLLRVAFNQAEALAEWREITRGVSNTLLKVEGLRTLDRLRIREKLDDGEVASRRSILLALIDAMEIIEVDEEVLGRAAQPMPTMVGSLDAIHLATALLRRDATGEEIAMATHDRALGIAAKAHGLRVIGIDTL